MRTSCRFAVATHVLAVLAYKQGEPVTSDLLASSVNTNPVVIRRLLLTLQEAGLVETRKGAGLGSKLGRSAERITLRDVYRAVECDELLPLPDREPNQDCPIGQCIQAALQQFFSAAETAMEKELARTTLADVLKSVHARCAKSETR